MEEKSKRYQVKNRYVFILTVTVICSFLLSLMYTILKDDFVRNEKNDSKKNILISIGVDRHLLSDNRKVEELYDEMIIETETPNGLPLYKGIVDNKVETFIIPISGLGLWDILYGYFAIDSDSLYVKGITFYSHAETPGLGGEVDAEWFQQQFIGKQIFNENNELVSIQVIKSGLNPKPGYENYTVSGISGATITSVGLEKFLKDDLSKYETFLKGELE